MESFENQNYPNPETPPQPPTDSAAAQQNPQSTTGATAGAPGKSSPYADSPFEVNPQRGAPEYTYQPQTAPKPKKPRKPLGKRILACVLVVALVAGGCLITAYTMNEYWEERSEAAIDRLTEKIDSLEKQIEQAAPFSDGSGHALPDTGDVLTPSQLYAWNVNSVVAISSTVQASGMYGPAEASSSGSGFILSEDGYVVTNYHVIQDAFNIDVVMYDGTEYAAEVVGFDSTNDLAVLKIEAEDLPAAALGSSSDLVIGDMVVAIGNPLGELAATQTVGYVSGINREVATDSTIINMIQTDAAINPGNSGGPLFNMRGEVIGITTAKYSGTTGSGASIEGIGFAIPIDDVLPIINDLVEHGYVTGGYLGVTVQNTDADSAAMFGLPTGAYVLEVTKGGSADRAGIQPKDIITDLGGHKVSNITELTRALRNFKGGDNTTVTVIRSGKEITMDITLDEKPQELPTPAAQETEPAMPSEGSYEDWFNWFFGG